MTRRADAPSNRAAGPSRAWVKVVVPLVFTVIAVAAAEAGMRMVDGYRLTSIRLASSRSRSVMPGSGSGAGSGKWLGETDAWPYVQQLPVAASVDREWFRARFPDRPALQPDAELEARKRRYKSPDDSHENYEWNRREIVGAVCGGERRDIADSLNRFDDVFVFDASDGTDKPTYRFLRQVVYPSGMRTNAFGWRGPEIALNKPPRTIRIAFVGASTTIDPHSEPYSYPELVGLWLNRWAGTHHRDVSFEVINAGREGINSRSIQAIVRQEILPVEPDLVVYYEGSNQFWPADFIGTVLPPRSKVSGPRPTALASYSAIARRVENVVRHAVEPGVEPVKPSIHVGWPGDLDERDPDLSHPRLPIELPHILGDVEIMRRALDEQGARLVMTSFAWIVYPGLVLDPVRDAMIFEYLNGTFWPFTYAHMRRYLDFQSQAFRKYASVHGLDFIDVSGSYPRDPRLFNDAIHMTRAGIHLHAWIAFNGIVPIIERNLAAHEWPRPARRLLREHPGFDGRRLVPMSEVRAACHAAVQ